VSNVADVKKALGTAAVDRFVHDGMSVGLGTGTTAVWVTRRIAERLREGSLQSVRAVATSLQTELEARTAGVPLFTLNDAALGGELDITIDGADEIDPAGNLIKGGGGALLREKVAAYASRRLLIIADESKLSQRLGASFAIPVEIVLDALRPVVRRVQEMGGSAVLREGARKAGPVVTDLGNLLLDVTFKDPFDPPAMEDGLKSIPGVLESGLFTKKKPDLLIGLRDGRLDYRER
jgi:ribose 5-phosphate isomerase A